MRTRHAASVLTKKRSVHLTLPTRQTRYNDDLFGIIPSARPPGPFEIMNLSMTNHTMLTLRLATLWICLCSFAAAAEPIKALLIAGGCCHDYAGQHKVLYQGIQARANVQVDVYWTDDQSTNPPLPLFDNPKWAMGYDVIIHDECAAGNKDLALVQRILAVHQHIPAVHLHCAMHSFRTGTDHWFRHLGLASSSHGPQHPIEITFVDQSHPITSTLKNWTTENEELYNNTKVFDAHPLAMGKQVYKRGDKQIEQEFIVAWTNEKQGARSFSTTIGHNTSTVADPRYLDLVTRGLLWACDKLNSDYQVPFKGNNKVSFNVGVAEAKAKALAEKWGSMPKDATLVKLSASSTQSSNEQVHAIDGDTQTRWCANGGGYPQWLTLQFDKPHEVNEIKIVWEFDKVYRYKVLGSEDGTVWNELLDESANADAAANFRKLAKHPAIRFLKIQGIEGPPGGWCSIREVSVRSSTIKSLWPADPKRRGFEPIATLTDPFKKSGNSPPVIEPLSPEAEAGILKDVRVAEGFEATVFAAPPAVNYPVFVAAAPDGTLYVSSDGNGSLGRDPNRGRVIRLRDLDGDGRADETKVFCTVDAPRGLVWDHDRLYLMHPPHLSAFIDGDGDGVAEQQQILVRNLAFGYDKRPADHTTNGLSIGVDGWLYVAGGDFGFMDAEGTDGRKLTHRGGGVIRVRPDGTGLQLYATGTRNILEVAVSPTMDLFARDNTNDGGGWDVRFHHFTGGEDHGYPRLYKNFPEECVAPLADYGGGSGCGAVYIDEPGFGQWNGAPFTADWGKGALFHHQVQPDGATYRETRTPQPFIRMTRPTDADVDASSRVYCASWKGATFKWEGTDVGYIVCVRPKEYQPTPLPQFTKISDEQLIELFESPSHRRRLAAQRELMRRGNPAFKTLVEQGRRDRTSERNLIQHIRDNASDKEVAEALGHPDRMVVHVAQRRLAQSRAIEACISVVDRNTQARGAGLAALAMMHESRVVNYLETQLKKDDLELRKLSLSALCRLHYREGVWKGQSWGTRPDTRGPYYQPEAWEQTDRIVSILESELAAADSQLAAWLVREMNRNRIQSGTAIGKLIALALESEKHMEQAVVQLASLRQIPASAIPLLVKAADNEKLTPTALSGAVVALAKVNDAVSVRAGTKILARLANAGHKNELDKATRLFLNSPVVQNHVGRAIELSRQSIAAQGLWTDACILTVASKKGASPEAQSAAQDAVTEAWSDPSRRIRLMDAARQINNHFIDDQIRLATRDANAEIAKAAKDAAGQLKISMAEDNTPLISSLSVDEALDQAIKSHGDPGLGEQLFQKINCVACHTVRKDVPQKGPYLGNIAQTYKRPDLAAAILIPGKSIAQGFATTSILTLDGTVVTGFVTQESADEVTIRDQKAKEYTIAKEDIELRKLLKTSSMPDGLLDNYTVGDLASLVDYLESLKNK